MPCQAAAGMLENQLVPHGQDNASPLVGAMLLWRAHPIRVLEVINGSALSKELWVAQDFKMDGGIRTVPSKHLPQDTSSMNRLLPRLQHSWHLAG